MFSINGCFSTPNSSIIAFYSTFGFSFKKSPTKCEDSSTKSTDPVNKRKNEKRLPEDSEVPDMEPMESKEESLEPP